MRKIQTAEFVKAAFIKRYGKDFPVLKSLQTSPQLVFARSYRSPFCAKSSEKMRQTDLRLAWLWKLNDNMGLYMFQGRMWIFRSPRAEACEPSSLVSYTLNNEVYNAYYKHKGDECDVANLRGYEGPVLECIGQDLKPDSMWICI